MIRNTMLFFCRNQKNDNDLLIGMWVATPDNQNVYQIGADNETRGGIEDYYLECREDGSYALRTKTSDLANASYMVSEDVVTFYDEGRQILAICRLNDLELDCSEKSYYAFLYTRKK